MAGGGTSPGCGCKGIRSCLLCEAPGGELPRESYKIKSFIYIPEMGIAQGVEHTDSSGWWFPFPGVCLIEDFVTEDEEREMVLAMDQDEWRLSQSGRRKQDFGPKVNFKKQKIKVGGFTGLPSFSRGLWERMQHHSSLQGFLPVEQCNLDYNSERGSAIDPHYDDSWLWGERLVSLNLLSDTVLTMSSASASPLQLMSSPFHPRSEQNGTAYPKINDSHCTNPTKEAAAETRATIFVPHTEVQVAIELPRRSLVLLYGAARHCWKHAIHREHIQQRRVCSTFRELSPEFSAGGNQQELGRMLLNIALCFQGKPV
ncbi:alpha-ketoglutarate-dependent dioxygenase alkB homolog 4 [Gastrophryne carolinensis]